MAKNRSSVEFNFLVHYEPEFPISKVDDTNLEYQDRIGFDQEHVDIIAKDIQNKAKRDPTNHGQETPIKLSKKGDNYQILAGFTTTRAMKQLGRNTIRADVYENLTDEEKDSISIGSNQKRFAYYPDELAFAIAKKKAKGYSIEQLCDMFALKKSQIYNMLMLSEMDKTIQWCLHHKKITLREALEIMTTKQTKWVKGKGSVDTNQRLTEFQRLEKLRFMLGCECPKTLSKRRNPNASYCLSDFGKCCAGCEYYKGIKTRKVELDNWEEVFEEKEINGFVYTHIPVKRAKILTIQCTYQPIPELEPLVKLIRFSQYDRIFYPYSAASYLNERAKLFFEKGIPIDDYDRIRFREKANPEQKKIIDDVIEEQAKKVMEFRIKMEKQMLEKEKSAKEGKTVLDPNEQRIIQMLHKEKEEEEELTEDVPEEEPEEDKPTQEEIDRVKRYLDKHNRDHKI